MLRHVINGVVLLAKIDEKVRIKEELNIISFCTNLTVYTFSGNFAPLQV